jgi:hypothetical protein
MGGKAADATSRPARVRVLTVALAMVLACLPRAAAAQVREADLLRGCWKLDGISSDRFWTVPFRFVTAKTQFDFLAGAKGHPLRPLPRPGDDVGDTVDVHGLWSIRGDSVAVGRTTGLSGMWTTLAMKGDSLVGTGSAFDDIPLPPGRTPPRFAVAIRRVPCPSGR